MSTTIPLALARETAEDLSRRKGEPAWLHAARLDAWSTYEATPMPTRQDEEWRRTDLRQIPFDALSVASPNGSTALPEGWAPAANALESRAGVLVGHDATPSAQVLSESLRVQGVIFTDLDTAVREHGDLVRRYLGTQAVRPEYSKFSALNAALWSSGAFLYVPANVEISLPLLSRLLLQEQGCGVFPRTLVVMGHHSKATLIEETGSLRADGTLSVPVVELILEEGADLTFMSVQEFDDSPRQLGVQRAVLERDARLRWLTATLGGLFSKLNVDVELRGEGTDAKMLGLYFATGSEFFDFHTLQDHIAPHAGSDLLFKGVLKDTARTVYSGLIRVHEGAQKTDAYQKNNNLILSPQARADSIPNLEIAANDVRCSHGATAGRVAEDQLFYLMARGLTRQEAERLIVTGFLAPLIEQVPLADLRERLYTMIEEKMAG